MYISGIMAHHENFNGGKSWNLKGKKSDDLWVELGHSKFHNDWNFKFKYNSYGSEDDMNQENIDCAGVDFRNINGSDDE